MVVMVEWVSRIGDRVSTFCGVFEFAGRVHLGQRGGGCFPLERAHHLVTVGDRVAPLWFLRKKLAKRAGATVNRGEGLSTARNMLRLAELHGGGRRVGVGRIVRLRVGRGNGRRRRVGIVSRLLATGATGATATVGVTVTVAVVEGRAVHGRDRRPLVNIGRRSMVISRVGDRATARVAHIGVERVRRFNWRKRAPLEAVSGRGQRRRGGEL